MIASASLLVPMHLPAAPARSLHAVPSPTPANRYSCIALACSVALRPAERPARGWGASTFRPLKRFRDPSDSILLNHPVVHPGLARVFLVLSDMDSLGGGVRMDGAEEIHLASGSLWRLWQGSGVGVRVRRIRCEVRWMDDKVDRQHHERCCCTAKAS